MESESFACSHGSCLGTDWKFIRHSAVHFKAVLTEHAGVKAEYGSTGRVCEKTCSF